MKDLQPNFCIEILPSGDTAPSVPHLSLPQVPPAQMITKRQHSRAVSTAHLQLAAQTTPFPQTPITPPLGEPLPQRSLVSRTKRDTSSVSLLAGPQVPFPTPRIDFSRSLRSSVTYIPRSMTRRKEPNMIDVLVACGTLVLIGLFILMLLYYFSS